VDDQKRKGHHSSKTPSNLERDQAQIVFDRPQLAGPVPLHGLHVSKAGYVVTHLHFLRHLQPVTLSVIGGAFRLWNRW